MFKGYRGIIYGGLCLIIILIGSYKVTISKPIVLNDVHSQLNQTIVQSLHQPKSEADVINLVKRAIKQNVAISISGTKHAMGGQHGAPLVSVVERIDGARANVIDPAVQVDAALRQRLRCLRAHWHPLRSPFPPGPGPRPARGSEHRPRARAGR